MSKKFEHSNDNIHPCAYEFGFSRWTCPSCGRRGTLFDLQIEFEVAADGEKHATGLSFCACGAEINDDHYEEAAK